MPEKPQQAMIFSMAPKRVLDEAELSDKDEDDTQQSEPMEVFNPPVSSSRLQSTTYCPVKFRALAFFFGSVTAFPPRRTLLLYHG